ncbi:MAG: glycosyltransferase family 2 protein [Chitinophagaceae bacterium]
MMTATPVAISKRLDRIPSLRPLLPSFVRVSAVIITYNEEKVLRRTLSRLYWCDEIIIVDSNSTDNTVGIAREFGCKVFSRAFDGYGSQKKFAVAQASNDWILCVDADEVLSAELVQEIRDTLTEDTPYAGFSMPMNMVFLNKEFVYGKESGRYFLRLFNKRKGSFNDAKVHEGLHLEGPTKKLQHYIKHYSYTSLHQYLEKCNRYSSYSADMAFSKGKNKSLFLILMALPFNFFKYYMLERNFMNGTKGFYWSVLSAYYHFLKYLKVKELQQTSR